MLLPPSKTGWSSVSSPLQSTRWSPPATGRRHFLRQVICLVEGGGFEPPKSTTADLQSAPFGRSGTPPGDGARYLFSLGNRFPVAQWSWRQELNPQPADYKSAALPIELRQHKMCLIHHVPKDCKG